MINLALEESIFEILHTENPSVVRDGIVDESQYEKIMFVLKEVNDEKGGGWDLRKFLGSQSVGQTWNNISRWVCGILGNPPYQSWKDFENNHPYVDQEFRNHWLRKIAVVNLKKTPGVGSSDSFALIDWIKSHKNILWDQLSLYKPKYTVCCGTFEYISALLIEKEELGQANYSSNGIAYFYTKNFGCLIDYCHPQAHYPANFMYTMLITAIKEINLS